MPGYLDLCELKVGDHALHAHGVRPAGVKKAENQYFFAGPRDQGSQDG
ncbi:MAG TPA: hypothetical protein VGK93_07270 [Candidatus Eisenbacteria bacterium]